MKAAAHPSALKVQAALGAGFTVLEFEESTHTAQDAASAIGCDVAQIAKSILFRAAQSGRAVLVVASGCIREDEKKVKALLGEKIERASPEFVKETTGFEIGGVPPLAHTQPCIDLIDQDLANYPTVWAAGGTSNSVFAVGWRDLVALTGGLVAEVAKSVFHRLK